MFENISGNERVKEVLKRILDAGRLPGALLFVGEEGIGKKLFALEVAKALNCRNPTADGPCGTCSPCKRISRLNFPTGTDIDDWKQILWTDHPDVGLVVAPKRVLYVDQMRHIELEANYRPFEGKARVFLVDEADKLHGPSANALLKVLEEPPPTSHIILITSRPALLLETIRSRCQMIRFSPLTSAEIEKHLSQNKLADRSSAGLLARVANGSIGRALSGDLETFKEQRRAMLSVLKALAGKPDEAQLLKASEQLNEAQYKDEFEQRLDVLETLIRDAWMLSLDGTRDQMVNEDAFDELNDISRQINPQRAADWILQVEDLREQLAVNLNRKIATDGLFMGMASPVAPPRRYIPPR
ncbi:MAG TPA: DNA polymerase III subunit delta' [Pyrinomonadaceae bacterium]|nr:DNA polymerase III subunit delta' [Pyrinomonadaceae bacterium]